MEIAPDGHVLSARPDTGNSKLRDAAAEAVKTWRFKPFLVHNAKVTADTKLTVEFGSQPASPALAEAPAPPRPAPATKAPTAAAAEPAPAGNTSADDTPKRFTYLEDRCRTLVTTNAAPAQQAKTCAEAADLADTLYGPQTFVPRRAAYIYASTAFVRTNDLKAATAYASKAVAVAEQGHDDASGLSAAYAARGQAEAFSGQLDTANRDLNQAEIYERQAFAGNPDDGGYHAGLKSLLLFHAQLLKGLGKPAEADAKTAEANKL